MLLDHFLEFFFHATGWFTPLGLLLSLSVRASKTPDWPPGFKRILFGGGLIVIALLYSVFWLSIFITPTIQLHLTSHGLILVGLFLVMGGARSSLRHLLSTGSEKPRRIPGYGFIALGPVAAIVLQYTIGQTQALSILDSTLNALNLSLLSFLYVQFGRLVRERSVRKSGFLHLLCLIAAGLVLLSIVPHAFVAAGTGRDWFIPTRFLRSLALFFPALLTFFVYRSLIPSLLPVVSGSPMGDPLYSSRMALQQRVVYLVAAGVGVIAVGAILTSEFVRSSIHSVEQTYLSDQKRVAESIAANIEGLTSDLLRTMESLSRQSAVKESSPEISTAFQAAFSRWQNVVYALSRVNEQGVLVYTYPEKKESIGANISRQPHVQRFLETRDTVMSGVFVSVQGFDAIALYVPVFRSGSSGPTFAGGVAMLIRTDAFSVRAFRNAAFLNPNPMAAMNNEGQIIAASDGTYIGFEGERYFAEVFGGSLDATAVIASIQQAISTQTSAFIEIEASQEMARRWCVVHPLQLAGSDLGSVILSIRSADVVSLYTEMTTRQVWLWSALTALLVITMGGIVFVFYRWSRVLETEVGAKVSIIQEREERLQAVLDSEPECVKILDAGGHILEMNPAGLRMIEASVLEEVRGKAVYPLIVPEHREEFRRLAREAIQGRSGILEFEIIGLKGTRRWMETHMVPLRGANGEISAVLGITRDTTERRKTAEALRQSEEKYRALFEESKDVVYISTPDGKLLDINPAGVELFGYSSKEEILRQDIPHTFYVNPADRQTLIKTLNEQGSIKDMEIRLRKKNGEEIIVLETSTCVRDSSGRPIAYRGILRDVTLQRKLEEEIRQAQKMESVGLLAGGVAHDFNNLLGGILGYTSYLKMKINEEHPFFRHLDTIERSALRAAELTSKLLAFARGGQYDVKPLNLNAIVKETVGLLERSIDKAIVIQTILDEKLPTLEGDASQIQQVLMNLCINARDAMPNGGKLLIETNHITADAEFARLHIDARVGRYVVLSVSDTGVGMDKQTMQRMFDPFFTTKEKGKGTGLGLSMVYGIVKTHGGFIRAYSEPGVGTTFRVYFPASEKQAIESAHTSEEIGGGTERILVVDDEDDVRGLVRNVLEGSGYTVFEASNGEEAATFYEKERESIDLVILDMIMPKMGGQETYGRLRQVNPNVRVLLSSGYSQDGIAREILQQGAVGFLQKPYRAEELLKKIRMALDNDG
ncbi:MAG TPA: PAS domain S-box protein [Bacteroidota bacterium]|nr:PAS domain S-box protein [Bacteroidota bacterium]